MLDDAASASAQRQALDMRVLSSVCGQSCGDATWATLFPTHRNSADFLRCRNVPIEKQWRQLGHSHVVESMARLICRQHFVNTYVNREQVMNCVAIFISIHPPDCGWHPWPGIFVCIRIELFIALRN